MEICGDVEQVGILPREESGVRIWKIGYGYSMVTLCALQQTKILVAMENGPSEDVYLYVYTYFLLNMGIFLFCYVSLLEGI